VKEWRAGYGQVFYWKNREWACPALFCRLAALISISFSAFFLRKTLTKSWKRTHGQTIPCFDGNARQDPAGKTKAPGTSSAGRLQTIL
jgi:hypothetical protein